MGYSPWGGKELGTTERLTVFTFSVCLGKNPWKKKDSELPLQGMRVQSLSWEDPLEEETAIHSMILAWRIPWTEEPGGLQSMGSQRVGHD